MPNLRVRVVQISDLHINRKNDDNLIGMLKLILAKLRPDVLIVSGDLANQPVPWQMKKAARIMRELEACCTPVRVLVMPGNHDYKIEGNFGLRRLTRIPFEIYFRRNGLDLGWWRRFGLGLRLALNSLYWKGKEMREPLIVELFEDHPKFGLAIFAINSNTLTEMMAAGKVEPPDLQKLYQRFDELEQSPSSRFLYKIAVVHHHPAPIADAPFDLASRVQESFMVFYNAGLFVRELSRRGFNLVLHGHKHVAGFLRISCEFPDLDRTTLPIAAAGSAAHPHPDDSRGHHLNIVDIFDDDTSTLESRFFSAYVESTTSLSYKLSTLDDIRKLRYDIFRRVRKYSSREVRKTVSITNEGYSNVEVRILGNSVWSDDGVKKIPLSLTAKAPAYLRGVSITAGSSEFVTLNTHQDELYHFKGEIDLGQTRSPSDGPFDFGYSYRVMNGHALTAEEFDRHYRGTDIESEFATITCERACDLLTLAVEFPPKYDLGSLELSAAAEYVRAPLVGTEDDRIDQGISFAHQDETSRIRGNLRQEPNCCVLTCPQPVPGMIYKLMWKFRKTPPKALPDLVTIEKCAAAKARLLALPQSKDRPAPTAWNRARLSLDSLARALAATVSITERLKVSLMIFDESANRLRTVCSNTEPEPLSPAQFSSGEGCAGYVFEKTRHFLYHRSRDPIGYFIRAGEQPEKAGLEEPMVLASFPWIYTAGPNQPMLVLGVVNVSSLQPATGLLALFGLSEADSIAKMNDLQNLINLVCSESFIL